VPITFTPNPNGAVLGPGIQIGFQSDFVGPLPVGSFWRVRLYTGSEPSSSTWVQTDIPTQSVFGGHYTPFIRQTGESSIITVTNTITDGVPAHADVELHDPSSIQDSGTLSAPWSSTSGLTQIIQAQGSGQGGFTAEDRANLQLAVDNSTVDLVSTSVPTDLTSVPAGRLPGDPPLLWSERVGPFQLVGRDVLDLPGSGQHGIWTGLRWFYGVIPPGWGMTPGAIDEFDARPAQLVPIVALQDGEEIGTPILDTNQSGGFQKLSPFDFTGKIAHDVAPGWSVSLFMFRVIGSG
jgi:hypothetical protein